MSRLKISLGLRTISPHNMEIEPCEAQMSWRSMKSRDTYAVQTVGLLPLVFLDSHGVLNCFQMSAILNLQPKLWN
jgi:hypothetical protein